MKQGLWAEPFGYAPSIRPPPPPTPIAPALASLLTGKWSMHPKPKTEYFEVSVANGTTVVVTGTTDCWHKLIGSAVATSDGGAKIALRGRKAGCGGADDVNGAVKPAGAGKEPTIEWDTWAVWTKTA